MCKSLDIKLESWHIIACIIIIIAGVALIIGEIDAKDFIAIINLVIGFITGRKVGIVMGKMSGRKRSK